MTAPTDVTALVERLRPLAEWAKSAEIAYFKIPDIRKFSSPEFTIFEDAYAAVWRCGAPIDLILSLLDALPASLEREAVKDAALDFYADREHWIELMNECADPLYSYDTQFSDDNFGDLARQALNPQPTGAAE